MTGPKECTYTTGLWNAALVAQLIEKEFGQRYHPKYVSALLGKLGFSYQEACFESDHLVAIRRAEWLEVKQLLVYSPDYNPIEHL